MSMNTQNGTFNFSAWENDALNELEKLQRRVSKAFLRYQSSTDKTVLGEATHRCMNDLKAEVKRIVKATPAIQQKVDEIVETLSLMAHFSGVTLSE